MARSNNPPIANASNSNARQCASTSRHSTSLSKLTNAAKPAVMYWVAAPIKPWS
ncbi:hypothetical protein D3C80_1171370 [compost metagenome]